MTDQNITTELDDEAIKAIALSEVQSGAVNQALWAKAVAKSKGNEDRCKWHYLKYRVQQEKKSENALWKWRGKRWLIAYLLFWIINGVGSVIVAEFNPPESREGASGAFTTCVLLVIFIWCASNDRGNKTTREKVLWVIWVWIINGLIAAAISIAIALISKADPESISRMGRMFAGFISIYMAMRRSCTFVERTQ